MPKKDKPPASGAQKVFDAWRKGRPNPDVCRFTQARRKLINSRLREFDVDELVTYMQYVLESDEGFPRWMRGGNPRKREYMDLTNLLRDNKLASRVEMALAWDERRRTKKELNDWGDKHGVSLGYMGRLRDRGGS
jgi:hypothetical protein